MNNIHHLYKTMGTKIIPSVLALIALVWVLTVSLSPSYAQYGAPGGAITAVDAQIANQNIIIRLRTQGNVSPPEGFVMSNPNRVILDFNQVSNMTGKTNAQFGLRYLRDVQLAQSGGKLRMVINVDTATKYEFANNGGDIFITLRPEVSVMADATRKYPSGTINAKGNADIPYPQNQVTDVRFRRGEKGEGKLVVTMSSETFVPDITQRGDGVLVLLKNTTVPVKLRQKLDLLDFATPVKDLLVTQEAATAKFHLVSKGLWEYSSYQTGNLLIVEVVPVDYDPNKLVQGNRKEYKGEKLSLNFQNVDIRSILQVIADFKDMNIIATDSVGGSLTLRLKDVPWDQALEFIMEQKDLGMEKNGNLILVAPKAELSARKRVAIESANQINDLQPLKTEVFKIKYHKASAIRGVLQERSNERQTNTLLSGRGSAVPDERTNTLIVKDFPDRLQAVRDLLALIDVPLPQVMIEARIVSTSQSFTDSFAPRLAMLRPNTQLTTPRGAFNTSTNLGVNIGGTFSSAVAPFTGSGTSTSTDGFVDLIGGQAGKIGFAIFDKGLNTIIGLEIDALESEGRAKTISNPRVVTQTNKAATISSGVQLPYQSATQSGATATSFISASLSLNVTPQVTPDGKVLLTVSVSDSSPGESGSINAKNVNTEVLVENGGTLVIGGIYVQTKENTEKRVPFFAGIPLVGRLFRADVSTDSKNEFLVFITPRVLADGGVSFSQ